jgi:hypothetical protein
MLPRLCDTHTRTLSACRPAAAHGPPPTCCVGGGAPENGWYSGRRPRHGHGPEAQPNERLPRIPPSFGGVGWPGRRESEREFRAAFLVVGRRHRTVSYCHVIVMDDDLDAADANQPPFRRSSLRVVRRSGQNAIPHGETGWGARREEDTQEEDCEGIGHGTIYLTKKIEYWAGRGPPFFGPRSGRSPRSCLSTAWPYGMTSVPKHHTARR